MEERLRFLREAGAGSRAHSHVTLLEHLLGVRALLEEWGARPALCDGGLFHSVYGTEFFPAQSVSDDDRDAVRAVIGDDAEEIAWLWCTIRRRSLVDNLGRDGGFEVADRRTDERVPLTAERLADLASLWCADTCEQLPRLPDEGTRFQLELRRLSVLALPGARAAVESRSRENAVVAGFRRRPEGAPRSGR